MLSLWLNTLFLLQSCKQLTFKCFILILSILFLRVALTHCTDMIAIQFFFLGPQVSAKAPGGPRVAQFVGPPTASVASRHLRRCGPCGIWVSRHGKHGKENRKDPLLLGPSVPLMYVPKNKIIYNLFDQQRVSHQMSSLWEVWVLFLRLSNLMAYITKL